MEPPDAGPRRGAEPSQRARSTIIFDFDGVLADTEGHHRDTFCAVLAEEGILVTPEDHDARFLGINDREALRRAFAEVGRELDGAALVELVERKSRLYRRRLEEIRPFVGAVELVEALVERAWLAIASGGRREEIEAILSRLGIREHFSALVSADDVERSKPAPDAYLEALASLRRSVPTRQGRNETGRAVAIEDSVHGVRAARAAGLHCIAVAHSVDAGRLGEADRVVPRLADLHPDELLLR